MRVQITTILLEKNIPCSMYLMHRTNTIFRVRFQFHTSNVISTVTLFAVAAVATVEFIVAVRRSSKRNPTQCPVVAVSPDTPSL